MTTNMKEDSQEATFYVAQARQGVGGSGTVAIKMGEFVAQ